MSLKDNLVVLRKKKGISQAELAEAIHVSRQAVSRWEVGTAIPSSDNLVSLGKFYEVSLDEILALPQNDERTLDSKQRTIGKRNLIIIFLALSVAIIIVLSGLICQKELGSKEQEIQMTINLDDLNSKNIENSDNVVEGNLENIGP